MKAEQNTLKGDPKEYMKQTGNKANIATMDDFCLLENICPVGRAQNFSPVVQSVQQQPPPPEKNSV
jgi:hypothetical protein